jgi:hypothetical protein
MNSKPLAVLALAVAGLSAAGLAQARGDVDVQWSVTIGSPLGIYVPQPAIRRAPVVVVAPPVYRPYQAYPVSYPVYAPYRYRGRGDADRDGIPNRYDRVYNPRWDRDGDGVPNRYDRNDRRDQRQPQHGHGQNDGPPRRGDDRPGR